MIDTASTRRGQSVLWAAPRETEGRARRSRRTSTAVEHAEPNASSGGDSSMLIERRNAGARLLPRALEFDHRRAYRRPGLPRTVVVLAGNELLPADAADDRGLFCFGAGYVEVAADNLAADVVLLNFVARRDGLAAHSAMAAVVLRDECHASTLSRPTAGAAVRPPGTRTRLRRRRPRHGRRLGIHVTSRQYGSLRRC